MTYNLIITEKPSAARKIASALADDGIEQIKKNSVSYFKIKRKFQEIFVVPAVGHLFGITTKSKNKNWTYPVFDVEWEPSYLINKGSDFTKKYLKNIIDISKKAEDIIIACDYDIEGETIGYTILKYGCKKANAKRMKFSTLTKAELINAYENASPTINMGLASAGTTRHILDFYFGINISRALTLSIKSQGKYKLLTSGRVQGPALYFLSKREKQIKAFVSQPFWQIEADCSKNEILFKAMHNLNKIFDEEKAKNIFEKTKNFKIGIVENLKTKQYKIKPPHPFNLPDLQIEAYKLFKITPKQVQQIAQKLYEAALISYPRTSSQKLDPKLGFGNILNNLSKNKKYTSLAKQLLETKLQPNNGKKEDPAHPAIYPTGELPKIELSKEEEKIYDLIVKRFFACFGDAAIRKSVDVSLNINNELFLANGKTTIKENWFKLYTPYVKLEETTLPEMKLKEEFDIKKIQILKKETQPPARYNEASIIKELEKRGLGTKATRAEIIDNLYKRGYLKEKRIEVTDLGMSIIDTLDKYCPDIISETLTRRFEKHLEEIEKKTYLSKKTIEDAKQELLKISKEFKINESKIGSLLVDAVFKTQKQESHIGKCPDCEKGNLVIKKGKFGRFIACDQYPECKKIISIPQKGRIKSANKMCPECNYPIITIINKGKKPQELCLNKNCKTKQIGDNKENEELGKCPKCKGDLVKRSSIYGEFIGCKNYPKCRYIKKS